ncbi:T6SS amidase immunity protein Tai4 family protein [Mitsuaria sp. BK037]|uniref:T6SS amidase immunity protein Tai4 family protein n=1 Tax=Mitsuaria sp. BK037 TaxID=2587122 RepID=UPI0017A3A028|nr:T6SS amidase immunity protein Tai4 family protein [Mitsuaria sp. BK037]MBB3285027.1 hypothetical protein [Mitsuaria sp. BK037]
MKVLLLGAMILSSAVCAQPSQSPAAKVTASATASYSQKTLLKNWTVSVCLAKVAKTQEAKEDANAAASAYMEFGRQPIEAYEPLRELADSYSKRVYSGAVQSEFNTMKCIDLMHSRELEVLATRLSKQAR